MIQNRFLPVFKCLTCGDCEKDFHKNEAYNENTGFCLRFKQNVGLDEKNLACWTNKERQHYKDLFLSVEKEKTAKKHIEKKQAVQLDLFLENQPNPFENV